MVFPATDVSWTTKKTESRKTDAFKLWCWRRLLSPLYFKEVKPVNPKGNQSQIFIGRTDAEVGAPILWPPDVKSQLTGKQTNKQTCCWERLKAKEKWAEDEMVR